MKVEVDYEQLYLSTIVSPDTKNKMYFRFLMPDLDPNNQEDDGSRFNVDFDDFPGFENESSQEDPMYVNNDNKKYDEQGNVTGEETYYYGMINLSEFTIPGTGKDKNNLYAYYDEVGNVKYKDMYIYTNSSGKKAIVFQQKIPESVLEIEKGKYNTGGYAIFVAESSGNLLTPECAGEAYFDINFDKTDFDMFVGGSVVGTNGSLSVCTNNLVDVKAYATAGTGTEGETDVQQLFAIYDWYFGPSETVGTVETLATECAPIIPGALANSASTFLRDASGVYSAGDPTINWDGDEDGYILVDDDILFNVLQDASVRNENGFNSWLLTPQGLCWLANDKDGVEWSWGQPNYVGYDMFGGRWRYTIPGYSYETDKETGFTVGYEGTNESNNMGSLSPIEIDVDAVTSATILGSSPEKTDNKNTNIPRWGNKPVDFRTLKADLETYRFFFPYATKLPDVDQTVWPVNPHNTTYVSGINYLTGELTFNTNSETGGLWHDDPTGPPANYIPTDGRLTPEKYLITADNTTDNPYGYIADHAVHYVTNYKGNYISDVYHDRTELSSDGQKNPGANGGVPYVRRYTYKTGIEELSGTTATSAADFKFEFWDLNNLIARMHYYVGKDYLKLYKDRIDAEIGTLATFYLTVIPTSQSAFDVVNLHKPEANELTAAKAISICPTPSVLSLKAKSWAPDIWYGETNEYGRPIMPYFNIEDVYRDGVDEFGQKVLEYEFMYTVRLPERYADENKTRPTQQFIVPFVYFDEVKNTRVKLLEVINDEGNTEFSMSDTYDSFSAAIALDNVYVGLIDPNDRNKLARNIMINHSTYLNAAAPGGISTYDTPQPFDTRWPIFSRDKDHAFEAYPLVYNSYNYFVPDPAPSHNVELEGDPLPLELMTSSYGIKTNRIAFEIMASSNVLVSNDLVDRVTAEGEPTTYHFRPGYTYRFALESTGEETWSSSNACDLVMNFQLKVVPDTLIWGGVDNRLALDTGEYIESDSYKEEWNRDGNWFIPERDNNGYYTSAASEKTTFAPLPETKVIIPADLSTYSTLEAYNNLSTTIGEKMYEGSKKIISMYSEKPPFGVFDYYQTDILNPDSLRITPWIEFDYNYVPNSADTIHFKHGGADKSTAELGNQYLLNYNAAKVDLTVNTIRWNSLTAPLRDMYSGDYSFEHVNPLVQMRIYNATNPQSKQSSFEWTEPFHDINIRLSAGMPYAVQVGEGVYSDAAFIDGDKDKGVDLQETIIPSFGNGTWEQYISYKSTASFAFPGSKMNYDFYDEETLVLEEANYQQIPEGGRDYGHRFVYEIPETDKETGSVVPKGETLVSFPVGKTEAGEKVLIGNPFMSHLDFAKFYEVNRDIISNEYSITSGNLGTIVDSWSKSGGASGSTTPGLTETAIAPMQSFMVKIKEGYNATANPNLVFTKSMSITNVYAKLRSGTSDLFQTSGLRFTATNDVESTNAILMIYSEAINAYSLDEDTQTIINEEMNPAPKIYTEIDEMYLK